MMVEKKILLVEDEEALGYLLNEYLQMKGFDVVWAKNGKEALQILEKKSFDLSILDVMMPELDGFGLAKQVQERYPDLPFIFLTARSLKVDVLKGFSLGAVDYLKKPIDEEELVVRIKAILSRIQIDIPKDQARIHQIGAYSFDVPNQKLSIRGDVKMLTTREAEVLEFLVRNKNNITTHRDILTQLWGENDYFNKKSLNVFITRLRSYLKGDHRLRIENVHGKGFVFREMQ